MAVNSDLTSLLQNVDLKSILGGNMTSSTDTGLGGGVLGAVLIGALLPRLLGDQNGTAATTAAALATHPLTSADVTAAIASNTLQQTTGNIQGEIWKAEGNVQTAISAAQNAGQLATLNAEIANLQGQSGILSAVGANSTRIVDEIHDNADAIGGAISSGNALTIATLNGINTNMLQGFNAANVVALTTANEIQKIIVADGTATRALIADLNTAALNRDIVISDNRIAELLGDRNAVASGVTVTNNINQNQLQQQQQQQMIGLTQAVSALAQHVQATNMNIVTGNANTTRQQATAVAA